MARKPIAPQDHELSYFTIEQITPRQWTQIKDLSQQIYDSYGGQKEILFCVIAAFTLWMTKQKKPFAIQDLDPSRNENEVIQ